jgi:hypothetical protein
MVCWCYGCHLVAVAGVFKVKVLDFLRNLQKSPEVQLTLQGKTLYLQRR